MRLSLIVSFRNTYYSDHRGMVRTKSRTKLRPSFISVERHLKHRLFHLFACLWISTGVEFISFTT